MTIRKGDQVVLPAGWLKLSPNPLKSNGQFSRYGLQWFATQIQLEDLPKKKDEIFEELRRLENNCDEILKPSKLLEGLDIENPDHSDRIIESLKSQQDSVEWWAFLSGIFLSFVRDAIEKNDIQQAIWAMGCAERCRSMTIFKEHLEEVVWMGQSAKRVIDILRIWDHRMLMKASGKLPLPKTLTRSLKSLLCRPQAPCIRTFSRELEGCRDRHL